MQLSGSDASDPLGGASGLTPLEVVEPGAAATTPASGGSKYQARMARARSANAGRAAGGALASPLAAGGTPAAAPVDEEANPL